jgi:hypothetical protein
MREHVAKALLNKAITLSRLDRPADALAAYDEVIARFGDTAAPAQSTQDATILVNDEDKSSQAYPVATGGSSDASVDAFSRGVASSSSAVSSEEKDPGGADNAAGATSSSV